MSTNTHTHRCSVCLEEVSWLAIGAWGHSRTVAIRRLAVPPVDWTPIAPSARSLSHWDYPCFMYDREGRLVNVIYSSLQSMP